MKQGPCGAVYVQLAEQPENDRLERCALIDCGHHVVELEWVRRNPERLRRYNEQVARYDHGQHLAAQVEQEELL